jgi:hypothetical protein
VNLVSILLLVVGGVLVLLAMLFLFFRAISQALRRQADEVRQRYPDAKLVAPGANFFGQQSLGVRQIRGNGTLVLTDTELFFQKFKPRKDFHIPLPSISAIETPKSHLGKTAGRPLLKVVYRKESGAEDAIAWYVPNLDEVIQQLESVT